MMSWSVWESSDLAYAFLLGRRRGGDYTPSMDLHKLYEIETKAWRRLHHIYGFTQTVWNSNKF